MLTLLLLWTSVTLDLPHVLLRQKVLLMTSAPVDRGALGVAGCLLRLHVVVLGIRSAGAWIRQISPSSWR
jgi:hypothetical protein